MMRGFSRFLLRLAGVLLIAGVALTAAGFLKGGRVRGLRLSWSGMYPSLHLAAGADSSSAPAAGESAKPSTLTLTDAQAAQLKNLVVEIGAAEVSVKEGSVWSLTVEGTDHYTADFADGVWSICTAEDWNVSSLTGTKFTITVPEKARPDSMRLSIGLGTLTSDTLLRCGSLEVKVGAGNMDLKKVQIDGDAALDVGLGNLSLDGAVGGRLSVDCGMGTVKCRLDRPADYGYTVDCGMGTVRIGNEKIDDGEKKTSFEDALYEIDCGMGTVEIDWA